MSNDPDTARQGGPDHRNIESKLAREETFPARMTSEYRVHVTSGAYEEMKAHAATTEEVELCGVLIGDVCRDSNGFFLKITAVIRGEGANNYGSQVTFTQETWTHINKIKDDRYHDQKIVGWYHTHPGFGIFLSKMDSFIQENFFNQPYQVAIVLETKAKVDGCFAWVNGQPRALSRWWIDDEQVALSTGTAEPFDGEPEKTSAAAGAPAAGARGGGRSLQDFPLSSLWHFLLAAVIGFLLGRMVTAATLHKAALQVLENEVYSIVEFAALNASASKDFGTAHDRVSKAKRSLEKADTAGAGKELADLQLLLERWQQDYNRRRDRWRRDMEKVLTSKEGLSDRITAITHQQEDTHTLVGALYVQRLEDMLRSCGTTNPQNMPEVYQDQMRVYLDHILKSFPEYKSTITKMYPALINFYYPPEEKKSKDAGSEELLKR